MKRPLVWTVTLLVILVAMCYMPLFIPSKSGLENDVDDALVETIQSDVFRATNICIFTITIVLSFDMPIDFLFGLRKDGFITFSVLLLGLWMFALIAMTTREGSHLPLYWCALSARDAISAFAVLIYLYQYGGPVWRDNIVATLILISLTGASSSAAFASSRRINGPSPSVAANITTGVCIVSFIAIVIANSTKYYRELRQRGAVWESKEYCCILYSGLLISKTMSIIVLAIFSPHSLIRMSGATFLSTVYVVLITAINIRAKEIELSALAVKVLAMKTSFVRYVSHEIRSPLQVISTLLGMLASRIVDIHRTNVNALLAKGDGETFLKLQEQVQSIGTVVEDSQSACQIVCDVLNGLLGDHKTAHVTLTGCTFSTLLGESLELYIRLAKVKAQEIQLKTNIPIDVEVYLNADAKLIKQVIGNIVSNAVKFSPLGSVIEVIVSPVQRIGSPLQGGGLLSISRQKRYEGVRILVKDQGCGISVENQKKLFKSIIQFNPNQTQNGEGSGIGLFMSYSIIKKHQGDMGVSSLGEGKGATFWIDIPIEAMGTKTIECEPSVVSLDVPAPDTGIMDQQTSFRVLCVDDIESLRNVVARSLRSNGISDNIDLAVNGAHALSFIQSSLESGQPYDLVLMDFVMPVLDGPTAAKRAREMGFGGLILGVTGNAVEADVLHFKNCGADEVLIKPLDMSVLKSTLAGFRTNRARRAMSSSESVASRFKENKSVKYAGAGNSTVARVDIPTLLGSVLIFIGLLLQLIPAILQHTAVFSVGVTSFPDSFDVKSHFYFAARISSITMASYMACGAVMDYLYGLNRGAETMLVITIGALLIWDIYILMYSSLASGVALFYAVQSMRSCISLFGPMLYLYQNCRLIWTGNVLVLAAFFDSAGFTMRLYVTLKMFNGNVAFLLMNAFHLGSAVLRTSRLYRLQRKLQRQAIWFSLDYSCYTIAWILAASDAIIICSAILLYRSSEANYTNNNISIFMISVHAVTICMLFAASRFSVFERLSKDNLIQNKTALISHVSHEIRSPLNIILLGIDYLSNNVMKDLQSILRSWLVKDASDGISISLISTETDATTLVLASFDREISQDIGDILEVRNACCEAIAVINDLLTYEKLERCCFGLERKVESLVPIVAAVVNELKSTAMVSGVHLEGTYVQSAYVNVDSSKIAYAIRNLLKYAIKIFPECCSAKVEMSLHRLGGQDEATSEYGCIHSIENQQGNVEPSHVCVKVTHDVSESNRLRHQNVLLSTFARGQEHSANILQVIEGGYEHSLRLYVCHGIVRAHEGKLHINYNHDKTQVEFMIDLPLVDDVATILSKVAIMESAARYGSASDALKRARSNQQRRLEDQAPDSAVHEHSRALDDAHLIQLPESRSDGWPLLETKTNSSLTANRQENIDLLSIEKRLEESLNLRVLCVDDDAANVRLLVRVLTACGICDGADTASNGQKALQLILESMGDIPSAKPYDIVFMDGRMPMMDGPTATSQARAAGFRGLIVGVTGGAFDDEIETFMRSGVDEVLLKPFVQSDLQRIISAVFS